MSTPTDEEQALAHMIVQGALKPDVANIVARAIAAAWKAGARAEREACVAIAQCMNIYANKRGRDVYDVGWSGACDKIAAAIRAREGGGA